MKFWEEDKPLTPIEIVNMTIRHRHSIRAFFPKPVEPDLVRQILDSAAFAPSGGNIQPWKVHVLSGTSLTRFVTAVCYAFDHLPEERVPEYDYYPREFFEPYGARRRKLGWDLYGLLGIERGEKDKMRSQQRKNFEFFGAPVGMIFTIDRRLAQGSWVDYGMFLQNIMLGAKVRGLDTCPQASWMEYPRIVSKELKIPDEEMIVCGMALGYVDAHAVENTLRSERELLTEFIIWHE